MTRNTQIPKDFQDTECICKDNWRFLVKEYAPLIGRQFMDNKGQEWTFEGLVWGKDDLYYGMYREGDTVFLSCVGSIKGHGFEVIE